MLLCSGQVLAGMEVVHKIIASCVKLEGIEVVDSYAAPLHWCHCHSETRCSAAPDVRNCSVHLCTVVHEPEW